MQLTKTSKKSVRSKLKTATCSLLAATAVHSGSASSVSALESKESDVVEVAGETLFEKVSRWKFNLGLLFYKEPGRVQAIEPAVQAQRDFGDGKLLSIKFVFDTLSGASPNGASPSAKTQTFTGASGAATSESTENYQSSDEDGDDEYEGGQAIQVAAGQVPLDSNFKDTRTAWSLGWTQSLGRNWSTSLGVNYSSEFDYSSLGGSLSLAREFNQKNTTLSLGVAGASDVITPVGGVPVGLSNRNADGTSLLTSGVSDSKKVIDAVLGLSQVIHRSMLMQINYSVSSSTGYQTDPYKIVSIIDDVNSATLGDTNSYIFEKRPSARVKQSVYHLTKYHLSGDTIDFAYRYMWDDWGVKSHTFDLKYRWRFSRDKRYFEPRLRYYQQTEADFYKTSLRSSTGTPDFISADARLGRLNNIVAGLKYGEDLDNGHAWSFRIEYYLQSGVALPDGGAIGSQVGLNLLPNVESIISQVTYNF